MRRRHCLPTQTISAAAMRVLLLGLVAPWPACAIARVVAHPLVLPAQGLRGPRLGILVGLIGSCVTTHGRPMVEAVRLEAAIASGCMVTRPPEVSRLVCERLGAQLECGQLRGRAGRMGDAGALRVPLAHDCVFGSGKDRIPV